jgi:hypothetical protein
MAAPKLADGIFVRMSNEQRTKLKELATAVGLNTSEFVRWLIDRVASPQEPAAAAEHLDGNGLR